MGGEVESRGMERKIGDAMRPLVNGKNPSVESVRCLYGGVLVPVLMYRCDILVS